MFTHPPWLGNNLSPHIWCYHAVKTLCKSIFKLVASLTIQERNQWILAQPTTPWVGIKITDFSLHLQAVFLLDLITSTQIGRFYRLGGQPIRKLHGFHIIRLKTGYKNSMESYRPWIAYQGSVPLTPIFIFLLSVSCVVLSCCFFND